MPQMKILDFIEKDGEGKYSCYKTRKLILDQNDQDTLDYDDKPAVQEKNGHKTPPVEQVKE